MIKALIVEDQAYVRKAFLNLLNLLNFDITILGECESVKEAITVTNACKPDLIFLDINLPDGTAFNFLEQTEYSDFKVIFITAYEEYALKALKIGAVDYLLKPVNIDELEESLHKAITTPLSTHKNNIDNVEQFLSENPEKIILSFQDSLQVITLKELMYCKSDKGYTTFFLENGKTYMASKTIKEFEEQFNETSFTRPHQSYIVNLNFIDKYDKSGTIHLKNKQKIPVSSRKKEHFISLLMNSIKNNKKT